MRARFLPVLLATGCLTQTHVIPREELQRLANVPPEQRGQRVRVVQGFAGAEEPPDAPVVQASTAIIIAPVPYEPSYGGYGYFRPSVKSMKEEAKWWIVIAAVTAVGLAVTEGLRFDGWVALHPMHPLHLFGPRGEWTWMPLADLTPESAAWASKGFVRAGEGPWHELERAPLDRVGLTYSLLLGTGEVRSFDGYQRPGFLAHIQFGFFPVQNLGLLFDVGLGWRTDRDFTDIFQSRYALEVQGLPLRAGPLHAGLYGEIGVGYRFEDFPDGFGTDRTAFLMGGGGLVQLELTTRLALTVHGGVALIGGDTAGELTAGISIY